MPDSTPQTHSEANPASRQIRVLLAEDNAVNQVVGQRMLTKGGYLAVIVGNGLEALNVLREEPIDLVLMDWHMPEMDGVEATRAIRAAGEPWSSVPIIALTANAMDGDRAICLEAGMNDYMSKPFMIEEFLAVIGRWTTGRDAA